MNVMHIVKVLKRGGSVFEQIFGQHQRRGAILLFQILVNLFSVSHS